MAGNSTETEAVRCVIVVQILLILKILQDKSTFKNTKVHKIMNR